ncbi:hypothetical protein BRARA_A02303, partial [Brassica rapa]
TLMDHQPKKARRNDQWCNRACIRLPPHGVLKCNYGAAYNLNNQQIQCGWIGQDSSVLEAEAMSLLFTMQSTWSTSIPNVIFEGDSNVLISNIHHNRKDIALHNLLCDIWLWTTRYTSSFHRFTLRNGNLAVHLIISKTKST